MQAENLESVFRDYVKSTNAPYAILISGTWGSGKTFFWKTKMKAIAEAEHKKTIYVSLNGIRKIETLEQQLFIGIIPFVKKQENGLIQKVTRAITNIANAANTTLLNGGLNELFKGILNSFDFSDYVICFDDLERSQIDTKETLGFINNFIEHKSLKAVILCDEAKIDQSGYNEIKEKVIGRVWTYEPNIPETLPVIIESFKNHNKPFFEFLQKNTPIILELISQYNIKNLRIISFYLSIMEGLFQVLKDTKQQYVTEVIFFTIIISNEFKKGKLSTTNLTDYQNLNDLEKYIFSKKVSESMAMRGGKDVPRSAPEYADEFYEFYVSRIETKYWFSPSIYEYVLTGFLNSSALADEIKAREPITLSPKLNAYAAVVNYKFRELENEEFKRLADEVLRYAAAGEYIIYDYAGIAGSFFYFAESNIITQTIPEIEKIVQDGLMISKQRKEFREVLFANLMHFGEESHKVAAIKEQIKKIHFELKDEKLKEKTDDFLNILEKGDASALAQCLEKYKLGNELFPHLNVTTLFNTLTKAPNRQLSNFNVLLEDRYQISNIGQFLYDDKIPLMELNSQLRAFVQAQNLGQPRQLLFESLIKIIDKICEHLENTRR